MQGDSNIDTLMRPVMAAIKRHVKDGNAITDIYNRAYEAVINSMDEMNRCLQFANTTAMEMKHRAEAAEKRIAALEEENVSLLTYVRWHKFSNEHPPIMEWVEIVDRDGDIRGDYFTEDGKFLSRLKVLFWRFLEYPDEVNELIESEE